MARTFAPRHLIIRTCGLYGSHGVGGKGGNFIETMLKLAAAGKEIKVVDDQRCTPSSTVDVASLVAALIAKDAEGLYHATNTGDTTWHGLASKVFALTNMKADLKPTTSAQYAAAAHRPAYSVLSTKKLESLGIPAPRPWQDAVAEYLKNR
jgi:dTDP-4-dehydrorhamnose reductase